MVRRTLSPGYAQTKLATSFPGRCKISPSYIKEKSVVSINKENNSKLEVRPANIYIYYFITTTTYRQDTILVGKESKKVFPTYTVS